MVNSYLEPSHWGGCDEFESGSKWLYSGLLENSILTGFSERPRANEGEIPHRIISRGSFFNALTGQPTNGTAKHPDGDWQMYNRDLAGTRYSPLTQINSTNVVRLRKAWTYRLRTDAERSKQR